MSDLFNEEIIYRHIQISGKTVHLQEKQIHQSSGENVPGGKKAGHGELLAGRHRPQDATFYKTMECAADSALI